MKSKGLTDKGQENAIRTLELFQRIAGTVHSLNPTHLSVDMRTKLTSLWHYDLSDFVSCARGMPWFLRFYFGTKGTGMPDSPRDPYQVELCVRMNYDGDAFQPSFEIFAHQPKSKDGIPQMKPSDALIRAKVLENAAHVASTLEAIYGSINAFEHDWENERRDAHTSHCCTIHGCKYGDDRYVESEDDVKNCGCTVVSGRGRQEGICPYCSGDASGDIW